MRTIGFYKGDKEFCDDVVGDGKASRERPIQDIAKDFANHIYDKYTSKGKEVDIVAHSMGGLISRVAVLGTREDWPGFPPKVAVEDVVTLGTPHQGLTKGCSNPGKDPDDGCTRQWHQMTRKSQGGSGFIAKLHESAKGKKDRGFDDPWAKGIDWSLVGSLEDKTVFYNSGIDEGYYAHQKYGFDDDLSNNGVPDCSDPDISHGNLRQLTGSGGYCLRYWHHGPDGGPYTTEDGWSRSRWRSRRPRTRATTCRGDGVGPVCDAGPVIVTFDAELWVWDARRTETWTFVSLPAEASEDIRELTEGVRRGFGSLRVRATVGGTNWKTSIFPDGGRGCFVLPVKRAVRTAEGLGEGDIVHATVELLDLT